MQLTLRKLLCAGILAGLLLAAPLWSQSPLMYTYQSLYENSGYMFGYGETGLWQPAYWCQGWWDFCYDEYVSYVTLDMSLDSSSMGSNWGYGYNGPAWTSVWSEVQAGEWQMDAHHYLELWYREQYWEWPLYAWLTNWQTLYQTVYPEISISSAQTIYDGDYGYFDVAVQRGDPSSYSWSFESPPGAGNYPDVNFDPFYDTPTLTDAHWFALPDSVCGAANVAQYTIEAAVGFPNGAPTQYASTWLNVQIFDIGGVVYAPVMWWNAEWGFVNGAYRVLDNPNTWVVRGSPDLLNAYGTWSQFWWKVQKHEEMHVDQYYPGGLSSLKANLWDAAVLRYILIHCCPVDTLVTVDN